MKILLFVMFCFVVFTPCLGGYYLSPKEVQYALDYGAKTKIVFFVVDDMNVPVQGARVSAHFYMNGKKSKNIIGETDKNGIFVAEKKSVGEVFYNVTKENFYRTRSRIWLAGEILKPGEVKDGKWQPYGATYKVVLKPRKNPIPMYVYYYRGGVPKSDIPIGYDLKVGDFVHPYGKGTDTDFNLSIHHEDGRKFISCRKRLILSFTNKCDGAYIKNKDQYSAFITDYVADTNAVYKQKLVFDYDDIDFKNKIDTTLSKTQYLVLRTRTKVNEKGEMIEAYYSKIHGPFRFEDKFMEFNAFINPRPNSMNLEFDKEKKSSEECLSSSI